MTNSDICLFCKTIAKACEKATCFDLCNKRIHIKCNNLNNLGYENLKRKDGTWYCKA